MNLFYVIMLGIAVSIDGMLAGVAYGLRNIRMPLPSLVIIFIVTGIMSSLALVCAYYVGQYMNTDLALIMGACLLILLGLWSLFQQYLTRKVPSYTHEGEVTAKALTFSIGRLVISIMAKPETADVDRLGIISPLEAVFLGIAVGLDGAVGTFAAALMGGLPLYAPIIVGLIHAVCVGFGCYASACFVSESVKKRFPYLHGALLILLGLIRL